MLIYNGAVQLIELANNSIVLSGNSITKFDNLSLEDRNILLQLVDGINENDIKAETQLVLNLLEKGLVVNFSNEYQSSSRFSRQIDFLSAKNKNPMELNNSIINKKILIIGCGGTGSMIAQALLGHGFNKFILVDDDVVQASNLNRQLFFAENDLGLLKVEALKKSILRLQSNSEVFCKKMRIQSSYDLELLINEFAPDFIVCGADYPPILIQKWVAEITLKFNLPVIFGGIGIDNSSLGPLLDSHQAKVNYITWLEKKIAILKPESLKPVRGSLASTNMAGSSFMAFEIFKYFTSKETCLSLDTRIIFDFKTLSVSKKETFYV